MENDVLPSNITLGGIQDEYTRNSASATAQQGDKKPNGFDEKNYLDVRLSPGEKSKTLHIRLLPITPTSTTAFEHVFLHSVEVPKDMVEPGKKPFKSYICLDYRKNPSVNDPNNKCPFCEENHRLYEESLKATTEDERKLFVKKSFSFKAKEAIIVRCIDRDHEDEGVKFWKFNLKFDNTDAYHQILNIVEQRRAESLQATGVEANILDLNKGRDFTITINEGNTDNQTSINVVEAGFDTPLSRDFEQAKAWINDSKRWQDVFTVKPLDYLKLVLDGKYPWFDRELGKWIDKSEFDIRHNRAVDNANAEIYQAEANVIGTPMPQQQSQTPVAPQNTNRVVSDEDLPF